MCAERGPTSTTRPSATRASEPPATAIVRTSSVRSSVRWPPIRAGRICGWPRRMTEQSALVPPTSMKMPSVTFSWKSAPAIPAAGPESIVRIGRRSTSATSITPPSLRMIISGAGMRASVTARAVTRDVRSMRGKIAALSAAVRVRARRPYCVETSAPLVAASPRSRAAATSAFSRCGRSTANGSLTATASTPASRNASSTFSSRPSNHAGANRIPSANANGVKRAKARATGPPSETTPTFATSPSSSAFVACVVECAMNAIDAGSIACSSSSRSSPATIPAATPSG